MVVQARVTHRIVCPGAAMGRLDGLLEEGVLRRWARLADKAERLAPAALHAAGQRARRLSRQLDQVVRASEARRLAERPVPRPLHADWAWRPELWSSPVLQGGAVGLTSGAALGREAKLFHDCPHAECAVQQLRAADAGASAHFGLSIEVYHFRGAFLSMAIDLPPEAVRGLCRRHLIRLSVDCATERPIPTYGRLNVRHGPNVAQVVRGFDEAGPLDLDLAATDLDEDRITAAWVDLIFEAPAMNRIVLGDVTLSRRPRAEI